VLLIVGGNQVPFTPLGDEPFKVGADAPEQIGATSAKSGVTFGITFTAIVCVSAHNPKVGVNTYEPLVVLLIMAGNQVPLTPVGDTAPKLGTVAPEQKSAIPAKSGCVLGVITTFKV
jgi:hypothetical protein